MPTVLKKQLNKIDWNFTASETSFLTHNIHPFPAKFIPQIPSELIKIFTEKNENILDPFCGSGTTVLEAIRLGRNGYGVDINPLAILIVKAKCTALSPAQINSLKSFKITRRKNRKGCIPQYSKLNFWFKGSVIEELADIKESIWNIKDEEVKNLLKVVFSKIIIRVSNQDSDTRYVRREKKISKEGVYTVFNNSLFEVINKIEVLSAIVKRKYKTYFFTHDAQLLGQVMPENTIDFGVTSPPYPNAFSYHLYHRNRLVWLGYDYKPLKEKEIGSHRKYSRKNGDNKETFKKQMEKCLQAISKVLKPRKYFCVVIGDSIIRGQKVKNDILMEEATEKTPMRLVYKIKRDINLNKKYFNPKIGKIKEEHILIFKNLK